MLKNHWPMLMLKKLFLLENQWTHYTKCSFIEHLVVITMELNEKNYVKSVQDQHLVSNIIYVLAYMTEISSY